MDAKTLEPIIAEHEFFAGFKPEYIKLMTGCALNVRFETGQMIFREGEEANQFYLIRHGDVSVEIHDPRRGALRIETVSNGSILGWSWFVAPYFWHFDARALSLVRAIALDAKCLRQKCDEDHSLGYLLMQRVAHIMVERLHATRVQLMDIYR